MESVNILLATGIYPPAIGGTATYAKCLAEELVKKGNEVTVVTYGMKVVGGRPFEALPSAPRLGLEERPSGPNGWSVVSVSPSGNVFQRWLRYKRALQVHSTDADIVIALSSVSVGVPLILARLKKPKKVLRLGGDFFWERYTDAGGMMGLRVWYERSFGFWKIVNSFCMGFILRSFDVLVYSTEFQKSIHERAFTRLPKRVVIENAVPTFAKATVGRPHPSEAGGGGQRQAHEPFRLLSLSRFVGFKNLEALVRSLKLLQAGSIHLTMIGSGPREKALRRLVISLGLQDVVTFRAPITTKEKATVFSEHDLLIIPSTTDISPNTALEANAAGLLVLLTRQTGLSTRFTEGMILADLQSPQNIARALQEVQWNYSAAAEGISQVSIRHDWSDVAGQWHTFLSKLL